ncbi:c-type cytochrome biogenesis protein CcsB [Georgenia sp. 10Sc9-8]|uniref:C-type cytochrome biogenesis protein CcsB n=1 Tax=Georgenia halotolerans TaxID=3028317 RepID=A0ABT5U2W8_9MICO|nr:c-type cytochrome biogenesis protein CcsB [Georgenia halotolerans]
MPESDLGQLSTLLVYAAMAAYVVALIAFAVDLTGLRDGGRSDRSRRAVGIAMATTWLGAGFHLLGVVLRGVAAGRVPWANMYEFSIVFTLVAVGLFLGLQRRHDLRFLGAFVVGPALLMLGVAVAVLYVRADGVQPALNSYWLVIHVSVATIAVGVFSVAAVLSALQLAVERHELRALQQREVPEQVPAGAGGAVRAPGTATTPPTGAWQRLARALPGSTELERLAFRLNGVGFMLWTFTVIAGAIWAEHAWGRPWGWDPKEVWSFVTWVVYAAYLHARSTRGWEGRRAAYLSLAGFGCILANYFVVNFFFSELHGYAF